MENESTYEKQKKYCGELQAAWLNGLYAFAKIEASNPLERPDGYDRTNDIIYFNKLEDEKVVPNLDCMMATIGIEIDENTYLKRWEPWKIIVVEEALHEYEHKCVDSSKVSSDAEKLHLAYAQYFNPPDRHGLTFFQAIVIQAEYFQITAEELTCFLANKSFPKERE